MIAKPNRRGDRLGSALHGVAMEMAPYIAAIGAFLAGLTILASAATPAIADRLRVLTGFAPIFVVEFSHFAASLVGLLLMLVGSGLWRRREGAFWFALVLLAAGAVFSLTKGLEYEEVVILAVVAGVLWASRKAFDRPSRLFAPIGPAWLLATVAAVASAGMLGLLAYDHIAYSDELWWRFVRESDVSRFLRAGVAVAIVTLIAALITLVSPPTYRRRGTTTADLTKVQEIIANSPDASPSACILLTGDKDFLFSDSGQSFIAFRSKASRWIALGPPMGPESERAALMWRFVEEADRAGATAVFYSAPANLLPALAGMGFIIRQIGEEAVVSLETFTISGKSKQNLRTACNKAAAEGCIVEVLPPGSATALASELKVVSEAWLKEHSGAEKSFSMGNFSIPYLDLTPLAVVRQGDRILAFANVLIVPAAKRAGIDLMRHLGDAPAGTMDFLFVRLIEWAKAQGYDEFNLGMAPLSGLENRRMAPLFARLGALVFAETTRLYSFGGLHAYKAKFAPVWRPLYMAGRPGVIMPIALFDVALLTGGGWRGLFLKG